MSCETYAPSLNFTLVFLLLTERLLRFEFSLANPEDCFFECFRHPFWPALGAPTHRWQVRGGQRRKVQESSIFELTSQLLRVPALPDLHRRHVVTTAPRPNYRDRSGGKIPRYLTVVIENLAERLQVDWLVIPQNRRQYTFHVHPNHFKIEGLSFEDPSGVK